MTLHIPEIDAWPPENIDLNDSRWLSVTQAAHLARADERTIRRWARERHIAVWLPGGRCWIDKHRLFSTEPPEMSETPVLPGNAKSTAPLLPGIIEGR